MKLLVKIFGISIFDFICIYGAATILTAIVWRIAGWEMSPYLPIVAFAIGRIFEMTAEKLAEAEKQIAAQMFLRLMKDGNFTIKDDDDETEG